MYVNAIRRRCHRRRRRSGWRVDPRAQCLGLELFWIEAIEAADAARSPWADSGGHYFRRPATQFRITATRLAAGAVGEKFTRKRPSAETLKSSAPGESLNNGCGAPNSSDDPAFVIDTDISIESSDT